MLALSSKLGVSLVSWCFESSQPLGIISGLKKKELNPSLSYSAQESFNTNHTTSVAQSRPKLGASSMVYRHPTVTRG